jgi:hypothetical protein
MAEAIADFVQEKLSVSATNVANGWPAMPATKQP